ncbi:MAG: hypothetical protein Q7T21_03095 [Gallionella sp.]|nr:hypothetical protein [Gallionella sp.]
MIAAQKSECPAATGQNAEKSTNTREFTPDQKRLATLRARAAMAGVVLHAIEGDCGEMIYIFSRWSMTRQLESIESAERWLDGVTGVKHG